MRTTHRAFMVHPVSKTLTTPRSPATLTSGEEGEGGLFSAHDKLNYMMIMVT